MRKLLGVAGFAGLAMLSVLFVWLGKTGVSADAQSLAAHPWWRGKVSASRIDDMLREMTASQKGVIYFDQSGGHIFAAPNLVLDNTPYAGFQQAIAFQYPAANVAGLGERRAAVWWSLDAGRRLTLTSAADLLRESMDAAINRP